MYHPTNAAPDTEFIEIFNASSDFTFDLSGYRLNGLDFTFADGNYLAPRSFALVVKNRLTFETFYGSGLPVVGEFHGSFDRGGELIQLIRSAASDREEEIVAEVRYDDDAPWPTEADGGGASLQLIDDKTDNRLVANWGTDTAIASTPGRSNSLARSLQPFPRLWINELQPLNVGDARDRASDLDPWIELYNQSTNRIDLLGYFLSDSYTNLGRWAFPPGSALDPGEFRVVWLDGEPFESTGAEFHTSFRLRATNAVVVLSRDLGGQLQIVDYAGFGKVSPGRSLGSFPDGDPIRRGILHYPTPGRTNNNALLAAVKINEWMASNVSQLADPANNPAAYDDWIELYNTANTPADLTGYTLTDNLDQPRKFIIPSGRIIPPHGFLLVWADSETNQNGLNPDLHAGFKLSQSGEDIGLFDPDGREIDSLKFDRQFDNISQGRWRDGEDNGFYFMSNATPRSSNIFPVMNTAPSLQATDQTVSELLPWTFSAVAFDPDVPPQKLAYTLRSGAPSGLTLNPTNGLLRWAPSEQQGGGDFSVVIDVVDNGVPPLSNSVSFHIFVDEMNAVPRLFPVSNLVSSNRALVAFTATAADTDVPAQNLSFSLDAGGPVGASIDSRTGQFSWIPAEMDAPALHMVTVRVSDDGAPVLTDAQNVTITLLGAPRIAALTVSPAEITIWVATAPGLTYRIDSSESLAPGEWVAEGPAFSGTGFQVPVTRTFSASARRFYRVVQLD